MPALSSLVEDLLALVLDQAKLRFEEYADDVKRDLEGFADSVVQRAVRVFVLNLFAVLLVLAGLIFAFVGVVTYLSALISPAVAWALVGLAMAGVGFLVLNRSRHLAIPFKRLRRANGN